MTKPHSSDLNLPLELETSLLRILAIEDELTEKLGATKRAESRVTLDLTGAKDDKGKLILTNDKQREAAVAEFLGTDESFLKLYGEVKRLQRERREVEASLERTRADIKYDLLKLEGKNLDRSIRLVEAIWQARQESTRIETETRAHFEPDPIGTPEFFRGPGLHIIPDSEAGAEDEVAIPF